MPAPRRAVLAAMSTIVLATLAITVPHGVQAATALDWQACQQPELAGFECATLTVPEDRRAPEGHTVLLALARHRSTGSPEQRIGSLVFNPGGPGGSGVSSMTDVWSKVPEAVRQRFDLVSWDPRGVGATRPALQGCRQPWPWRPLTGEVPWGAVVTRFQRELATANRACDRANPGVLAHVGTMENVADLDRIRAALGEERLTYWGLSYGTRIGYVYALLHPGRLRALVLDGSIDPASTAGSLVEGGAAPDQAYGSFADAYPVSDARLRQLLDVLDRRTFQLPGGATLDRWVVLDFVYGLVAQQAQYPTIARFVDAWHGAVFGSGDAQQSAAALGARAIAFQRALPNGSAGGVFSVTNCMDYADRPPIARTIEAVRWQVRLAPQYGGSQATMYGVGCAGLTTRPDPIPVITGAGLPVPALILGSTRDGSTIVQWTARMSRAFPNSRTVTYAGGQHVVWGGFSGSACVADVADRYVIDLQLPDSDRACPNAVAVAQP